MSEDFEQAIGHDRRTFVKRLVIGSAFAAPVISSFTMSGVQAVFGNFSGPITGATNSNTSPTPPANYTEELICGVMGKSDLTIEADDGPVHITLLVPELAFPLGTIVCIYKGDLVALGNEVPSGETPSSAYGVAWNPLGDASIPLVMTVTGAPVNVGDPVYMFNKTTGVPESVGTVLVPGTWVVNFTDDPGFVVTDVAAGAPSPVVAQATTTG